MFRARSLNMQFYDYVPLQDQIQRYSGMDDLKARKFMREVAARMIANGEANSAAQYIHDQQWSEDRKPYYNVYPSIIPLLTRIDLDFPGDAVHFPHNLESLVIRLPKGHNQIVSPQGELRSILVAPCNAKGIGESLKYPGQGLAVYMDIGEKYAGTDLALYDYVVFRLDGINVQESLNSTPTDAHSLRANMTFSSGWRRQAIQLLITLLLIQDDPNLINPDVLAKDDQELLEAIGKNNEERIKFLQDRAFRRRGPGWEIGRRYERIPGAPYVVPPHPQRYWVGAGRTKCVVKTRSGYVVDKTQIIKLPTGYQEK
jgi:hypothetical protein